MPKRTDIKKILIIGSGPIVIGQACEFDYSGSQACKALKEEGYQVVLINSNPATIMTDPELADRTYIEPITPDVVEKIIAIEKPDAVLPTVGGQTALNVTLALGERGVFDRHGIELIGANINSIKKAEDRDLFKQAMVAIGMDVPKSGLASSIEEALAVLERISLPIIIRPAFTLGGTGGNIVYNREDFIDLVARGLDESPISQVLLEESVIGWKEFELEVMRDRKDNVVIICSIENIDPMGIHTGDSITVAPQQTLSDREYQNLRNMAIKIIREIGVDTGGSNIQFAVNPADGRVIIIEMNPRVSRSSALASKATGFPIAKIAAKLAVGLTLDEIPNDITRETPASFEPTIDYVVVKTPRWAFEKFEGADSRLGTQMKSVGEAMAIGRTFKEAFQKALRSLEIDRYGFGSDGVVKIIEMLKRLPDRHKRDIIEKELINTREDRMFYLNVAFKMGWSVDRVHALTGIDRWFLEQIHEITAAAQRFAEESKTQGLDAAAVRRMKQLGFSDRQLGYLSHRDDLIRLYERGPDSQKEYAKTLKSREDEVRRFRFDHGIVPGFRLVDTCGGEFAAYTPYYYSSHDAGDEAAVSDRKKIMILGGGPNRIGQGIEFDYCCCHASFALREEGIESIMVNSNPETVSTDYDTSDRLYFEPLTLEDVLHIYNRENPDGVIVQFGGQTPLRLARALEENGVRIIGTSPDSIDRAEDRERFAEVVRKLGLLQPENGIAFAEEEAIRIAGSIGYPVLVRPSYVLGGRAMAIIYDEDSLRDYIATAVELSPEHPILVDDFLEDAIEVDVDAISDGADVFIGAIMEHVEEAGIHSGDSACIIPPLSLSDDMITAIAETTEALARELNVIGLLNIQFAIKDNRLYVIEVNPRASRTVPFVSKTTGVPLAKMAVRVMLGKKLAEYGLTKMKKIPFVSVKEAVLPFNKFPGVDTLLSPEMKSTGEVMGISHNFGESFYKATLAAGDSLPLSGTVLLSISSRYRDELLHEVRSLHESGFKFIATEGTAQYYNELGIPCGQVHKVSEGRPNIIDLMKNKQIDMIINTPSGKVSKDDSYLIRQAGVRYHIPYMTTVQSARAAIRGLLEIKKNRDYAVRPIQEYHKEVV
ncbi:MAG TPA: carbamoyl-phosphate synthase large subunit [Spirochaetota bacterium]|nr:carbamoyl-phosphate synthase large subunit [Spirochaetota bacterium]HPL15399.1 carbamoyl-phosphate synthase large subunit [Spirochaetota bacterium]HQF08307.1 carbamoyl-phosphate synthase large subunit [Spirochaetota bacterium]HQH97078.1 carbamoyl-phosphate synthase large subunit [Spirochaetota bacterium]HQJ69989.1 carbamoyl-phosphate synthase large subunit [Spirochaetota bacterium]